MLKITVLAAALAMIAASGAAARLDPYKSHRSHHGHRLSMSTEVVKHRAGGDPGAILKSPGRTKYAPITLQRGATHDTALASWAAAAKSGAPRRHRRHP